MAVNTFKKVTEPLQIKSMKMRNRIVFPPMVCNYAAEGGFVSQGLIDYHRARARNVGLDIVELTLVRDKGGLWDHQICIYDDKFIPGLAKLAHAIKAEGAAAAIQICDIGARSGTGGRPGVPLAPSKIPAGVLGKYESIALTTDGIKEFVHMFAEAGRRAFEAGFDAVEIHAAHMYLISQFLSPYTNKRTDEYGGSTENRSRFLLEIIKAVKEHVPKDFPILCRINGNEPYDDGIKIEEAEKIAQLLEQAGCDIIDVSAITGKEPVKLPTGQSWGHTTSVPFKEQKPGCYVEFAAAIKKVVNVPVITVGKIWSLKLAENILEQGKADLIAIGRGLIADPDLPKKELEGREEEVVRCSEDRRCQISIHADKSLACKENKSLPPTATRIPV